jgi:DNA mismatch endonuclease (patch repair protein)
MDVLTKEQRRKNMQAIRSTQTKMEVILAKAVWANGYRYRKNDRKVFGNPDLTFKRYKIAVFVDGEYFHGKDWGTNKHRIKTNRKFWWNKIETNMKRDIEVNRQLQKEGWKILRFWSQDVKRNLRTCIQKIERQILKRSYAQKVF